MILMKKANFGLGQITPTIFVAGRIMKVTHRHSERTTLFYCIHNFGLPPDMEELRVDLEVDVCMSQLRPDSYGTYVLGDFNTFEAGEYMQSSTLPETMRCGLEARRARESFWRISDQGYTEPWQAQNTHYPMAKRILGVFIVSIRLTALTG